MNKFMEFVKNNKLAQLGLALFIGVAIGAVFYPTKNIEERVKKEYEEKLVKQSEEHRKTTKELSDKYDKAVTEKHSLEVETTKKISSLNVQIKDLQSKTKESYYKIVRPDGTIEVRKFKESEVNESTQVITKVQEEFNQKIKDINERYEKVHRERVEKLAEDFAKKESEYKSVISKYESERKVEINPKKYGLEVGYLSNKSYYGHANVDVFGPFFVGVHTQLDMNTGGNAAVGAGVGLRF